MHKNHTLLRRSYLEEDQTARRAWRTPGLLSDIEFW
jgi:hypothetical protein